MRSLIQRLAIGVFVLAFAHTAAAQTADEIIEKSITAQGGRAAFQKIKTRTLIKVDLTSLGAGPMQIDQRFDGATGYVLDSMQGDRPISGNQLDNMKNGAFPNPFLTYKASGASASVAGKEKMDGRDAFVVVFEPTAGSPIRSYIDAETYMPIATRVKTTLPQVGEVEQTSHTSDYRDVDGVKIPFKIEVSSAIQTFTIVVNKVEHNTAIDDKLFVKPQ